MRSFISTFSLRKSAKLVRFKGGLIKFADWLKREGYLMNDMEPYQEYVDRGYFTYTYRTIKAANKTVCVPRLTIKGLHFFNQKLNGSK